jgi:hypothetical protein
MATLSGSFGPPATQQISKVQTIQNNIAAVETACETLVSSINPLMAEMIALNTMESLRAANSLLTLRGVARGLKSQMEQAHGPASNALLDYDGVNGPPLVVNGPGR